MSNATDITLWVEKTIRVTDSKWQQHSIRIDIRKAQRCSHCSMTPPKAYTMLFTLYLDGYRYELMRHYDDAPTLALVRDALDYVDTTEFVNGFIENAVKIEPN